MNPKKQAGVGAADEEGQKTCKSSTEREKQLKLKLKNREKTKGTKGRRET